MAQRKESNRTWTFYGKYPKSIDGANKSYKRRGFKTKKEAKLAEIKFIEEFMGLVPSHITIN